MPITFSLQLCDGYFVSTYSGAPSDADILNAYETFFKSDEWSIELNELVDLSRAQSDQVTKSGLKKLVEYAQQLYETSGANAVKTAVYAPQNAHFGLARMYGAMAATSPEYVRVFRDLEEAKNWLKNG